MADTTCPVFRPTLEEFSLGLERYVDRIESHVAPHGICKIIPPKGWWDKPNYNQLILSSPPKAIASPVKQCVAGARGRYTLTLLERPSESMASFRVKAESALEKAGVQDMDVEARVRKFWRSLSSHMDAPMYGADSVGTLFGGAQASGWNVDELDSPLRRHCQYIPGVTSAMLYAGMWGAMFAFHVEDMNLYSINYIHTGQPKSWWSIKPHHANKFERMAQAMFPDEAMGCPEFLRHKQCLVSPTVLAKHGIDFDTVLHEAGEFVLTFPMSYHAGFNHGFNIAESTNFATRHWSSGPGVRAGVCTCREDVVRIDIHEFHRKMLAGEAADRFPSPSRKRPKPSGAAGELAEASNDAMEHRASWVKRLVRGTPVEVMWENDEWYQAEVLRVKLGPPAQVVDVVYTTGEMERDVSILLVRACRSSPTASASTAPDLVESAKLTPSSPSNSSQCPCSSSSGGLTVRKKRTSR